MSISIAGCAAPTQGNHAEHNAAVGGVVGGAAALALCKLSGRSNATCAMVGAAGAAGGAMIGWKQGKEQDLAEARTFAQQSQRQGLPVSVKTAEAVRKEPSDGSTEKTEAIRSVTLGPLLNDKIIANDPVWASGIREIGRRAAVADGRERQQIVANVTPASRANVSKWLNEGVAQANTGRKIDIEFFDTKKIKETVIFYQPLDRSQFPT